MEWCQTNLNELRESSGKAHERLGGESKEFREATLLEI